jgi:membrane dipeptidase
MKFFITLLIGIFLLTGCANTEQKLIKKADNFHASILTVDTHCDTPMEFSDPGFDMGVKSPDGCVDFPKMKEGGLHAEFFAVYTPQGPETDSAYALVHDKALKVINAITKNVEKNSAVVGIAFSPEDARRLRKSGKIAAFIGLENGYCLGRDLTRLKEYFDLGCRYLTLSHIKNNYLCDSSTDPDGAVNNGLSTFGAKVVKEMNHLGMMVDISHISDKSFFDVLKVTNVPVIASHSSCRALCGSPRNLSDDMLLALKENGGVIQVCLMSNYLKTPDPNPELDAKIKELQDKFGNYELLNDSLKKVARTDFRKIIRTYAHSATVKDLVDHIDHVVQVIGIDYVGIGTDFDGGGEVDGCRNASEMKNITIELLRRGYSKTDITKIWGGNIMRVMQKVQDYAKSHI